MSRAITFAIAFMLSGAPTALACVGSCAAMSMPASSDGRCQHDGPATAGVIRPASDPCATPMATAPFVIEAQHRAPSLTGTPLLLTAAAIVESPIPSAPGRPSVPGDSPPARSPFSHAFSIALRI